MSRWANPKSCSSVIESTMPLVSSFMQTSACCVNDIFNALNLQYTHFFKLFKHGMGRMLVVRLYHIEVRTDSKVFTCYKCQLQIL